jgi:hypothetical protein
MKALICILGLFGAGLGSTAFAQCQIFITCGNSPEDLAFDSSGNLWAVSLAKQSAIASMQSCGGMKFALGGNSA